MSCNETETNSRHSRNSRLHLATSLYLQSLLGSGADEAEVKRRWRRSTGLPRMDQSTLPSTMPRGLLAPPPPLRTALPPPHAGGMAHTPVHQPTPELLRSRRAQGCRHHHSTFSPGSSWSTQAPARTPTILPFLRPPPQEDTREARGACEMDTTRYPSPCPKPAVAPREGPAVCWWSGRRDGDSHSTQGDYLHAQHSSISQQIQGAISPGHSPSSGGLAGEVDPESPLRLARAMHGVCGTQTEVGLSSTSSGILPALSQWPVYCLLAEKETSLGHRSAAELVLPCD
ncbi:hypothetical protein GBAR_LOCUS11814 [Geodia barretti]|uniref:Uncharacterized protein n=1 Tax=Geodia barretti TaxID=519541 RepID=A0AA35WGI0_GEOBA|nr:hypothetical protein GBAR_LOCUS11814 [Geodia barretti]